MTSSTVHLTVPSPEYLQNGVPSAHKFRRIGADERSPFMVHLDHFAIDFAEQFGFMRGEGIGRARKRFELGATHILTKPSSG